MTLDKYIKNYLAGKLAPSNNGAYLETQNPSTKSLYAQYPDTQEQDVAYAIESGQQAYQTWYNLEIEKRYRLLMRVADIIEQENKVFAKAEATDTGKPYAMAISQDIPQAYSCLRYYATSLPHYAEQSFYQPTASVHYKIRRPLGVVACFPHWSFPLLSLAQLVGPALVAGNCVIVLTDGLAPMSAYLFAKSCIAAGIPPGVVNILHGNSKELAAVLFRSPLVKATAFAGDAELGLALLQDFSDPFRRSGFLLGAKNVSIVFADCNFHKMIVETLRSSFSNNGQHPYSTSRILVERPIYDKFKEELVKRTQFLKVGDAMSTVTDLGAIISQERLESLLGYITLAEAEDGVVLCGGKPLEKNGEHTQGYFFRPAVIEGLAPDSRLNQEDMYGPIVTIQAFDTDEEAIQLANATELGRAASLWTQNTGRANRLAQRIGASRIWINAWMLNEDRVAFIPISKSGTLPLGGMDTLQFFTQEKTIGQPL